MTDIVERLRRNAQQCRDAMIGGVAEVHDEAAVTIAALRNMLQATEEAALAQFAEARIEGARAMQARVARALRLYPEWCKNWGLDRNMRVATEAANECADMLATLPDNLPDDDDDAAMAIYKTLSWWIEAQKSAAIAGQHKGAGG